MSFSLVKKQSGMALIIVLWMLVVMTAMALAFSGKVRSEILLTANFYNQAKAISLAESGIWRGAAMILNRAVAANNGNPIDLDGSIYSLDSELGQLQVSLQSCNGLVDLNRAPPEIITSLLQTLNIPVETTDIIVDSLLDWRDEDDIKHLNGAERTEYLALGLDYGPKNGLMNSTSELARVNGVTAEVYRALKSMVTVHSGQPRIDIHTAPIGVVSMLLAMEQAKLVDVLDENKQIDVNLIPIETRKYIGTGQNEFFKISSFAKVNNSVFGHIAIVKLEPTERLPVTVLAWRDEIDAQFMGSI